MLSSIRTPRTRLQVQGEQGDVRYTCCVLRVPPHVGICATRELRIRSVKIPSTRTFSIILSIIQNTSYTTDFAWLFTFRKRSHEHLLYNTIYYPKHVVQHRFRMVVWRAANVFFFNRRAGIGVPGLHRVQGRGSPRGLVRPRSAPMGQALLCATTTQERPPRGMGRLGIRS